MLENLILSAATLLTLAGTVVYESSADWNLPGLLRGSIPLAIVALDVALLRYRKEQRRERLGRGAEAGLDNAAPSPRVFATHVAVAATVILSAPYWLPLARSAPPSLRVSVPACFLGVAVLLGFAVPRWRAWAMSAEQAFGTLVVGAAVAVALVVFDSILLSESFAIQRIVTEMNDANSARLRREPSRAAVEQYLEDLRRIDTGFAPDAFQGALRDYIKGFGGQLVSYDLKDDAGAKADNARTKLAQAAMDRLVKKYR